MKFKLYSLSVLAIAALMTACSNEDEIVQTPVTASEVSTPAIKLNLDELATRGFVSEKGAWTNFKANENEVGEKYDARISLMVYSTNNSENPIAIAQTKYLTQAQAVASGDQVEFQPLRVPAGASYTAVAFVDFVGKDHADKFYKIDNLNNIEMIGEETIVNGSTDAEMRDCYNGKVTFTLTQDGTLGAAVADATGMIEEPSSTDAPEAQEIEAAENEAANVTTLQILARRHLAKVRIIMTDYNTYGEWKQYFAGEDADRAFNAEAMKVKGLATKYNALTEATVADSNKDKVFVSEYDYQLPTVNYVFPGQKTADGAIVAFDDVKEAMSNINMRGYSYATGQEIADDAIAFPVLSFNYFIPADETDAAVYDMEFAALAKKDGAESAYQWTGVADAIDPEAETVPDWQNLMVRKINSVPVVKNTLTTIWGNFLTAETPHFLVTINDVFDNEIDRVLLNDEGTTYTLITIAGVKVEIYRNADGTISQVDVDKNEDKITADNWDELIAGLNNLKEWYDDGEYYGESILAIYFNEYLKDGDPILNTKISELDLFAEGILDAPYTSTEFINNIWLDLSFGAEGEQPKITLGTTDGYIEVDGCGTDNPVAAFTDLDLKATDYVDIDNALTDNVKTEAPETYIDDSQINGNLDVTGDAYIDETDVTDNLHSNTTISGSAVIDDSAFDNLEIGENANIDHTTVRGTLLVEGDATIDNSLVEGDATINGTAALTGDTFYKKLTLNGQNNVINGDLFKGNVILNGSTTINGGTFNDDIDAHADVTVNGGTVVAGKYLRADEEGITITLNAYIGGLSHAVGLANKSVIVKGDAVDPTPEHVDKDNGKPYSPYDNLNNEVFDVQVELEP